MRKDARFFLAASLAALALRLVFVLHFPAVVDDSRLYADIAENWLQHGIYGITDSGQIMPTLSRLPGYPAFLAAIFAVFGWGNFRAVLLIQVLFDLGTCFLIADLARRFASERAAKAAFLLAALCPFLANYSAAVLTETLEIFFTTLTLDLAMRGIAGFLREPRVKLHAGAADLGGLRSFHRGMHSVAARRRHSVRRCRCILVPDLRSKLSGEAGADIGDRAPVATHATRGSDPDHRHLCSSNSLDAA